MKTRNVLALVAALFAIVATAPARAADVPVESMARGAATIDVDNHPGKALFAANCAMCHEGGMPKAPHREFLEQMAPTAILHALNDGAMKQQASALTAVQRYHGLSGRTEIAEDGGMIFAFKHAQVMQFVMRDCPADIDIIFVNQNSRITAMHHMAAGPVRTEAQKKLYPPYPNAPKSEWLNREYEDLLKKYSSRYDACIVIELKGGTLKLNDADKGTLEVSVNIFGRATPMSLGYWEVEII